MTKIARYFKNIEYFWLLSAFGWVCSQPWVAIFSKKIGFSFRHYISFPSNGRNKVVLFEGMASITADKMTAINTVFSEIVRWVCRDRLSGYCSADSTVEYTLMNQPSKKRVIVHLVNYKVDGKGTIIPETNTLLKIAMPNNLQMNNNSSSKRKAQSPGPKSVKLLSPDFNKEININFKEIEENGWLYTEFCVPELGIYDIAVIDHEA